MIKDTAFYYRKHMSEDASLPNTTFLILSSDDILKSSRHSHLGELARHNFLPNLTHFEVRIFRWKPHLRPIFEMTKALKKLAVWTWDYYRGLLKDLHPEVVGDNTHSTEEGNPASPARVRLPLPMLRELTIIEVEFHGPEPDTLPPEVNMAIGARKQRLIPRCFEVPRASI